MQNLQSFPRWLEDLKPQPMSWGGLTVWSAEIPVARLRPTMKPVKLMARLIRNSTRRGDAVLDIFAGSGSTLIACEQIGRRCYALELDPHYCDVIIDRWEKMTGGRAEKIN